MCQVHFICRGGGKVCRALVANPSTSQSSLSNSPDSLSVVAPQISCVSVVCVSVVCSSHALLLTVELQVHLLHFLQEQVGSCTKGSVRTRRYEDAHLIRSVDNNQSPDGTNEWIQKVKRWSAFTLKRVRKVFNIVVHSRINREKDLSPEF